MTITHTLINPGKSKRNYMASQRVQGIMEPVVAIGHTRSSAIALCELKASAAFEAVKRRTSGIRRIPVHCAC